MTEIIDVKAREILDSRGNPTVEADVFVSCGAMGRAGSFLRELPQENVKP